MTLCQVVSGGRQRQILGTDLAECVSVPGDFLRPQGPSPLAFTPFRGVLGSLSGAWGAPNKGSADGAEGIFGKLRVRVGYGPAPGPTQKRPCAIHARKVGRASNTADQYRCYPNSTRSYLFYVTLSFLCNIICYLISVFVFSLVTLSVATTNTLNHLTVYQQMRCGSFKNCYQQSIRLQIIYLIYTYKQDLALNNLPVLIRRKIQPTNQPTNQP